MNVRGYKRNTVQGEKHQVRLVVTKAVKKWSAQPVLLV